MKKVKIKIPAKLNLSLDILGAKDGYHELNSLVCSVSVYDEIIVSLRSDDLLTLRCEGIDVGCAVVDNNAYKAGKLFKETFSVGGVDIKIKKNIPIGSGMGGSSADIAGVLLAMKSLFGIEDDVSPLADVLGSDSRYMLTGGFAVMRGRGDIVENITVNEKLYIVVITDSATLSARQVYKKYDKAGKKYPLSTEQATAELVSGNLKKFLSIIKNDLYPSALSEVPIIGENICALEKEGALRALMTGSGTATFGIFADKKSRDKALKNLKATYGERVFGVETV